MCSKKLRKKDFEENDVKITIGYDRCTGAGDCVTACPADIFEVIDGKAIAKEVGECIEYCACVSACPNGAILGTVLASLPSLLLRRDALLNLSI
ncbi:MAG: ferredoxin family protein [Candidatus Thermoplasmatota archaeon]|nr:ferredoxin family protein [Candidatus Thermoplasmatota archaeon]